MYLFFLIFGVFIEFIFKKKSKKKKKQANIEIHTRTLSVSVSGIDVLVEESVTGGVSCRQPQVQENHQQGAQQREHGVEMGLFWGNRSTLIPIKYKRSKSTRK